MSYSPFRHINSVFWKRKPIHLTVFLTRRCNLRCPFCFYLSGEDKQKQAPELSLDELKKTSFSAGKLLWLAFSGGEIFLREDIVEIAKAFYERNRPAIMLFPTNGLLTYVIRDKIEAILRHCKKSTIVVKLSLEGLEELHDSLRGMKGSFQKTMKTYLALGSLLKVYPNFELGVNTVFSSSNQDHMKELIDFINGLDRIKTHTVSLIRGSVADERLKDIDTEKYHDMLARMEVDLRQNKSDIYRFKGAKLKAAQDILQRRLIYKTSIRNRRLIPCYAGKLNIVITEPGDVFPCESFSMNMGNVRENGYSIANVLKTEKAQQVLRSIQEKECYCTHECYMMTNILFNPRMYPSLMKEYARL
ncbi:MAG: radical SAM protein [Nitrospiraceae bacterium]|nr:MAG: radical SAM protein [Nitrospiraceae bacterium]